MHSVTIQADFSSWRQTARQLILARIPPENVIWNDSTQPALFTEPLPPPLFHEMPRVSKLFFELARHAAAHHDPQRWSVMYRLLWRGTAGGEKGLLGRATDPDVRLLYQWSKQIHRDIHKMHAFVRFRLVSTDEQTGREQFLAWFEPEHPIVELAAPFFLKRFCGMDWAILTPLGCVYWENGKVSFTEGVSKDHVPDADAHDDLWRTYYRSIFNPARLKLRAMRSEMPQKYWQNLPEAEIIQELTRSSHQRVETMMETPLRPIKPAPKNPYLKSLHDRNVSDI